MTTLVDANVLLRGAQPGHPLCRQAADAVAIMLRRQDTLFFCPQNIAEFWHVATRPNGNNGLGMSRDEVVLEIQAIETLLTLLPDTPAIYPEWKRLIADFSVMGLKVFDARLVAIMNVHGVKSILTYNTADFVRYTNLTVIHPSQVQSNSI